MKTDIDIKDDVYMVIKGTELAKSVSGKLSKTLRPNESASEDIVISVLANQNGEKQDAYVNVNIYVADLLRDNQSEEDTVRLRALCSMAESLFKLYVGDTFRITLDSQRVLPVNGSNEHIINNKLHYQQINA